MDTQLLALSKDVSLVKQTENSALFNDVWNKFAEADHASQLLGATALLAGISILPIAFRKGLSLLGSSADAAATIPLKTHLADGEVKAGTLVEALPSKTGKTPAQLFQEHVVLPGDANAYARSLAERVDYHKPIPEYTNSAPHIVRRDNPEFGPPNPSKLPFGQSLVNG